MGRRASYILAAVAASLVAGCGHSQSGDSGDDEQSPSATITLGYSDRTAAKMWAVVEQDGFFKKEGVNVTLKWFPTYTDSLNAFAAGQIDANCQTWGDTLGELGRKDSPRVIMALSESAGSDAIVAKAGIESVRGLRGKTVGTELGTVGDYVLRKALRASGMGIGDIHFVNINVQDCPAAMLSGKLDACGVWGSTKPAVLNELTRSHDLYDSGKLPNQITDIVVMQPLVVQDRKAEVQKIVNAWYDAFGSWRTDKSAASLVFASQTSESPAAYQSELEDTRIFDAPDALAAMTNSTKPSSLYTSGADMSRFLVSQDELAATPEFGNVFDTEFTRNAIKAGLGLQPPFESRRH